MESVLSATEEPLRDTSQWTITIAMETLGGSSALDVTRRSLASWIEELSSEEPTST